MFSQTRLILAALQAHHNKNSEFVQNSDAKLPTSNSTMIIICTMSTPLSSIRFLLSAQVLLSQERSCRPRLHCCKQKLTFHWSNNHAMASRGHAATEKLYYYSTRHAKGWNEQSGQENGSSGNRSLNWHLRECWLSKLGKSFWNCTELCCKRSLIAAISETIGCRGFLKV